MQALRVKNPNNTEYYFFVERFNIEIEAKAENGTVVNLRVEFGAKIEDGKIKTTQGYKLPIKCETEKIQNFLDSAKTRKLMCFDCEQDMYDSLEENKKNAGQNFENDKGQLCFYLYNN